MSQKKVIQIVVNLVLEVDKDTDLNNRDELLATVSESMQQFSGIVDWKYAQFSGMYVHPSPFLLPEESSNTFNDLIPV